MTTHRTLILETLKAHDGRLPYRRLREKTGIKTAGFSRTINKLRNEGFIHFEGSGHQKTIILDPSLLKEKITTAETITLDADLLLELHNDLVQFVKTMDTKIAEYERFQSHMGRMRDSIRTGPLSASEASVFFSPGRTRPANKNDPTRLKCAAALYVRIRNLHFQELEFLHDAAVLMSHGMTFPGIVDTLIRFKEADARDEAERIARKITGLS